MMVFMNLQAQDGHVHAKSVTFCGDKMWGQYEDWVWYRVDYGAAVRGFKVDSRSWELMGCVTFVAIIIQSILIKETMLLCCLFIC